jgi:hypothetical protein
MNDSDLRRRRRPRKAVTVLADIQGGSAARLVTALVSDISIAGAKFLTNAPFRVRDSVALRIRLSNVDQDAPTIDAAAKVVRVEPLGRSRVGLWSHAVAVQFERELGDHQSAIDQLAAIVRTSNESDRP